MEKTTTPLSLEELQAQLPLRAKLAELGIELCPLSLDNASRLLSLKELQTQLQVLEAKLAELGIDLRPLCFTKPETATSTAASASSSKAKGKGKAQDNVDAPAEEISKMDRSHPDTKEKKDKKSKKQDLTTSKANLAAIINQMRKLDFSPPLKEGKLPGDCIRFQELAGELAKEMGKMDGSSASMGVRERTMEAVREVGRDIGREIGRKDGEMERMIKSQEAFEEACRQDAMRKEKEAERKLDLPIERHMARMEEARKRTARLNYVVQRKSRRMSKPTGQASGSRKDVDATGTARGGPSNAAPASLPAEASHRPTRTTTRRPPPIRNGWLWSDQHPVSPTPPINPSRPGSLPPFLILRPCPGHLPDGRHVERPLQDLLAEINVLDFAMARDGPSGLPPLGPSLRLPPPPPLRRFGPAFFSNFRCGDPTCLDCERAGDPVMEREVLAGLNALDLRTTEHSGPFGLPPRVPLPPRIVSVSFPLPGLNEHSSLRDFRDPSWSKDNYLAEEAAMARVRRSLALSPHLQILLSQEIDRLVRREVEGSLPPFSSFLQPGVGPWARWEGAMPPMPAFGPLSSGCGIPGCLDHPARGGGDMAPQLPRSIPRNAEGLPVIACGHGPAFEGRRRDAGRLWEEERAFASEARPRFAAAMEAIRKEISDRERGGMATEMRERTEPRFATLWNQ